MVFSLSNFGTDVLTLVDNNKIQSTLVQAKSSSKSSGGFKSSSSSKSSSKSSGSSDFKSGSYSSSKGSNKSTTGDSGTSSSKSSGSSGTSSRNSWFAMPFFFGGSGGMFPSIIILGVIFIIVIVGIKIYLRNKRK